MTKKRLFFNLAMALLLTVPLISLGSVFSFHIVAPMLNVDRTRNGYVLSAIMPILLASPVNALIFALYYLLRVKKVELADTVVTLGAALADVKELHGIIPICSHCHKIRDEKETWDRIEKYISTRTNASFSHGICPECEAKHYPDAT